MEELYATHRLPLLYSGAIRKCGEGCLIVSADSTRRRPSGQLEGAIGQPRGLYILG